MIPLVTLPATCELCGQWMPKHSGSCPRNGVHPSQWSLDNNSDMNDNEADDFVLLEKVKAISPFGLDVVNN
ncbi:hypothetical protein K501DRAFT_228743 [Backusella circina FSU 941]|nr:hypothetical protein K501DRAFT_228743 [Backusella circina FSU 941]